MGTDPCPLSKTFHTHTFCNMFKKVKCCSLELCPFTPVINTSKTMWKNDKGVPGNLFPYRSPPLPLLSVKSLAFADIRDTVQVLSTVKNKINIQSKLSQSRKYTFPICLVKRFLKRLALALCISQTSEDWYGHRVKRPANL